MQSIWGRLSVTVESLRCTVGWHERLQMCWQIYFNVQNEILYWNPCMHEQCSQGRNSSVHKGVVLSSSPFTVFLLVNQICNAEVVRESWRFEQSEYRCTFSIQSLPQLLLFSTEKKKNPCVLGFEHITGQVTKLSVLGISLLIKGFILSTHSYIGEMTSKFSILLHS